jgi:hypothetical protein
MNPLLLTGEERERLIQIVKDNLASTGYALTGPGHINILNEALEILTSPRYEALGLSKEQLQKLSRSAWNELPDHQYKPVYHVLNQLASSLQEIPIDGITGFPLSPANENDLEEGNQIASSLSDKGEA